MAQTFGLMTVVWRGQAIAVDKGGKFKLGGIMQKPVITGQQVDFANEFEGSEVNAVTRLKRGDSLLAIWAPGAGELQITCDTGQSYTWPDAFLCNLPEATAGDGGKVPLKWNAGAPTELVG